MEKGWRQLRVGEILEDSDEYFGMLSRRWIPVSDDRIGIHLKNGLAPHRRQAKPGITPRKKARSWDGWANLDHDNEPTFFSKTPPSKAHTAQYIRVRITEVLP